MLLIAFLALLFYLAIHLIKYYNKYERKSRTTGKLWPKSDARKVEEPDVVWRLFLEGW